MQKKTYFADEVVSLLQKQKLFREWFYINSKQQCFLRVILDPSSVNSLAPTQHEATRHNACLCELKDCHSLTGGQGHTGTWLVNTAVSAQLELLKNFLSTLETSSNTTHQPFHPKGLCRRGNSLSFLLSGSPLYD